MQAGCLGAAKGVRWGVGCGEEAAVMTGDVDAGDISAGVMVMAVGWSVRALLCAKRSRRCEGGLVVDGCGSGGVKGKAAGNPFAPNAAEGACVIKTGMCASA
eukprot:3337588-Alexandrium_andersonii.AAC.1